MVLAGAAVLLGGALWLRDGGTGASPFRCHLHDLTGLHCPGCGMTRAAHASLNGELAKAFRYNPVGMTLLPLLGLALSLELAGWVRGRPLKWRIPIGARGGIVLAVVVVGFGVLRNLPWWPFTLLAP